MKRQEVEYTVLSKIAMKTVLPIKPIYSFNEWMQYIKNLNDNK